MMSLHSDDLYEVFVRGMTTNTVFNGFTSQFLSYPLLKEHSNLIHELFILFWK